MRIIICPVSEAARILQRERPSHIVSLASPDQPQRLPKAPGVALLTLRMHDIPQPAADRLAPTRAMIEDLLAFTDGWTGEHPLMAQCWAGVSRSTAAAYIAACQKFPERAERDLAAILRRASPVATPNSLMVEHADALLRREGRMIAAIGEIGRGADFVDFSATELRFTRPAPRA